MPLSNAQQMSALHSILLVKDLDHMRPLQGSARAKIHHFYVQRSKLMSRFPPEEKKPEFLTCCHASSSTSSLAMVVAMMVATAIAVIA